MQIILTAREPELYAAWQHHCGELPNVTVHQGSILELQCDAIVSPANSFGFMDGGLDLLYSQHFGWQVQQQLQQQIHTYHHGELLVGCAEIVETDNLRIPYVIAAPTMRVPMILQNSVNPYLAARAVLLLITQERFREGILAGERVADAVQTVAFPGLGTGVGKVAPHTCAHQVAAAINHVFNAANLFPQSWSDAQQHHQRLYTSFIRDLQKN